MDIEVIVSTMYQENYNLLKKLNLKTDAVIINQCDSDNIEQFEYLGHRIKWINSTERGLSKSRNMALRYATADIVILADEDEELCDDYNRIISDVFEKYEDAIFVGFQVEGIEKNFKIYKGRESKIGMLRSMRMSSVELAFRRSEIYDAGVKFNEHIGAGTKYLLGEENAFLFSLLRYNKSAYYVPKVIAKIHIGDSTWFTGYNKSYMIARGAAFTAMSKTLSGILIFQFALRHKNLYKDQMSVLNAIKYMYTGKKLYIEDIKKDNNEGKEI